jgi:hypothetical protein
MGETIDHLSHYCLNQRTQLTEFNTREFDLNLLFQPVVFSSSS